MGKRSRKHKQRHGKNKLGCMWSWMSMFDFGHGRGNQKLLSDKRSKALNTSDCDAPKRNLKMLKDVEEVDQRIQSGNLGGELMADANKQSVKKLIEEEMVTESTSKRNKIALSGSELGSLVKRNQQKVTKMCKTSSQNDIPDTNIIEKLGSDDSGSDLYIEAIMQDIFNHIQQKSKSWSNNQPSEQLQSEQKVSLLKERISEATKAFMHRKILNGEHLTEARKVQYYNKCMDTLEMLDTNKEFFLKLSEDPNSSLMKQIKNMPSNSSIQKPHDNFKLSEEHGNDLQYTFFRKNLRLDTGNELDSTSKNSEQPNKIVILKPDRTELHVSTSESNPLVRYNAVSQFSLNEIRKRLRLAMQKDRQGTSSGDVVNMSPYRFQKLRTGDNILEKDSMRSPSRSRFYVEKIPKPSSGSKLVDKVNYKSDTSVKQRVSSIYAEAKRHLSELLSKGDEDEGLASIRTPKTLERLLSLPEGNLSHCGIPGRNSFDQTITPGRFSTYSDARPCIKNSQEFESVNQGDLNDLWSLSSENDLCGSDDNSANVQEPCNPSSNKDEETLVNDKELAKTTLSLNSTSEDVSSDGLKGVETTESQAEIAESALGAICEPASSVVSSDEQNTCPEDIDEEEACSEYNEQDTSEEYIAASPSPLVHPFFSAINIDTDDLACPADKSERPSPISVLEYVFSEDEVSPAGTELHSGNAAEPRRLRPIRIQFDEDEQSSTAHDAYMQGCVDNLEIAFKYVEAVMSSTKLYWEDLYMVSLVSSQLLNVELFDEVEEHFSQLSYDDRRLLFDCVNEILDGMCQRYFGGCPLISFPKLNIRPVPHSAVQEVWDGVEWHLKPPPHAQSLEQIVRKDLERDTLWMDLSFDVEELSIEMETSILREMMEDAVLSCIEVLVR